MHTKRFAALLLGVWIGGSLFMMAVAIGGFQGVDQLLAAPDPSASQFIKALGADSARMLLRHQVSELNRLYFENWELVQVCLGIGLAVTMLFATNGEKLYMGLCGFLLLLVIVEHFLVTPQVVSMGRAIDFLPEGATSVERIKFWRFHNAYSTLEVLKMVTLAGMSLRLMVIQRRNRPRKKINLVDDSDDG